MEKDRKIKIAIIVITTLLALSVLALAGTIIYKNFFAAAYTTVTVPDNIITQDKAAVSNNLQNSVKTVSVSAENSAGENSAAYSANADLQNDAAKISLHNKQSSDNTPFNVENMLPGDSVTKYFCVQVSYQNTVTVKCRADIRLGSEKLAQVLKCKIVLLTTNETLYDGLMSDMPESLNHKLTSSNRASDELYYEATAYLNTSVGNEYMNKNLSADLHWWVDESGNLRPSPGTGDNTNILMYLAVIFLSLCMLIILFFVRRRRENEKNA